MSILANDIPVALDIPIENINKEWLASIGFVPVQSTFPSWSRTKYGYELVLRRKGLLMTGVAFWEVEIYKLRKRIHHNKVAVIPVTTVDEFISIVNKHQPHERPV